MRSPRHDPEEIRRLLELRDIEKLTYRQLSERSGIPVHVLTYRASQDRQASRNERAAPAAFVEILDVPDDLESSLEIIGPLGHRIVVTSASDTALLQRVLRTLPC